MHTLCPFNSCLWIQLQDYGSSTLTAVLSPVGWGRDWSSQWHNFIQIVLVWSVSAIMLKMTIKEHAQKTSTYSYIWHLRYVLGHFYCRCIALGSIVWFWCTNSCCTISCGPGLVFQGKQDGSCWLPRCVSISGCSLHYGEVSSRRSPYMWPFTQW